MQSRREVQRDRQNRSTGQTIRNLLIVIVAIIVIMGIFYLISNQPRSAARRQTVSIAKKYAHLKDPESFYIYNRESTYYTIAGKNDKDQPILVIVPQHGGNVRVLKQNSGLTAQQVIQQVRQKYNPQKVLKVAPGVFNDKVVWEVTYRNQKGQLCYELVNFKTGKVIQSINNL
ncbi:cell wall elongation regulator TseB-like domain-containing protein [Limosilactobacillus fastidiosus]|uniref:DUF5590 domain-containing protein n=1 Tax=Limosilactobacillus fastidiosus TaxID=2759855 RepID=A0A7W3U071_9LACO|nr:DUF5590 domain-containing protein [Limosilactobacillus fastidiosus]MBB1062801.1 DUF5590 domain-containing protein [Limosilactobacillus fastidiosus]MBB1086464.1 DUF5590 domain-containing protein [Limosilactobacillus fastidiosus]MCD7084786.1 DUF5590 domain-containing protein [Limosilactobacillus fastidiosus]MCD7085184.1 DUF5590 domain-containing protein [Limosilactobacillus fastidiosus]MCD7115052.1 DUF5590 domain-containing protein [Limosilactobacillus fastidiosus]